MSGDYVCNTCGKQFVTKSGLSGSNWAVHNTVESPCTVCDKIFTNKKHLAVHMSNTHAENQRFSCDFKTGESACSYYSTIKTNLTARRLNVWEGKKDDFLSKRTFICARRASRRVFKTWKQVWCWGRRWQERCADSNGAVCVRTAAVIWKLCASSLCHLCVYKCDCLQDFMNVSVWAGWC